MKADTQHPTTAAGVARIIHIDQPHLHRPDLYHNKKPAMEGPLSCRPYSWTMDNVFVQSLGLQVVGTRYRPTCGNNKSNIGTNGGLVLRIPLFDKNHFRQTSVMRNWYRPIVGYCLCETYCAIFNPFSAHAAFPWFWSRYASVLTYLLTY